MLPATGRVVVLLCGPPGAGKTTAAHASGLAVYDRDDPQWPDERTFRNGIANLASDPTARAVVIRSGASSTARAKAATLIGATHQYLLTAEPAELAHRIATRRRSDARNGLASIKTWYDRHDTTDGVQPFPGWHLTGAPNVTPTPPTRPPPSRSKATARSGRPWRRTTARVIRRDNGLCHLCGMPGADTADHLTPVSAGGALHALDNLAAAHLRCNKIRGARPIAVARAELQAETRTDTANAWTW